VLCQVLAVLPVMVYTFKVSFITNLLIRITAVCTNASFCVAEPLVTLKPGDPGFLEGTSLLRLGILPAPFHSVDLVSDLTSLHNTQPDDGADILVM
jgi:hypothetical protein